MGIFIGEYILVVSEYKGRLKLRNVVGSGFQVVWLFFMYLELFLFNSVMYVLNFSFLIIVSVVVIMYVCLNFIMLSVGDGCQFCVQ